MLNNFPVATVTFIVSVGLIAFGYVSGDIEVRDAFEMLALAGGGSAAIGFVRNGAGHGVN